MFNNSKLLPVKTALTFALTLLLSGISLFAPNAAPAAHAQTLRVVLALQARSLVQPGQNLTYTIKVRNESSTNFTNFSFYNDVPANTTFVSASGGIFTTGNGPSVEFTLPTLAANETKTVSWVAKVASNLAVGTYVTNDSLGPIGSSPEAEVIGEGSPSTKIEAPGTLVAAYRNSAGTAFDVSLHGYQFNN